MSEESVKIILSAQDQASAVIRKSKEEIKTLNSEVTANAKGSQVASDAASKLASVFGAGWIAQSATQMKTLSEVVGQASESLQAGQKSSVAMRVGLVALVAYGSVQFGKMIGDWIFETKRWQDAFEKSIESANKKTDELAAQTGNRIRQELSDIREFTADPAAQQAQARELASRLSSELQSIRTRKQAVQEQLDELKASNVVTRSIYANEMKALEARITQEERLIEVRRQALQEVTAATVDDPRQAAREAIAAERERELFARSITEQMEDQLLQAQLTRKEYELMKVEQMDLNEGEKNRLSFLIKQRYAIEEQKQAQQLLAEEQKKQIEEQKQAQQLLAKEQEKREKESIDAMKKRINLSINETRELEKTLRDIESNKIDLSMPSLAGSDSRLLTQGSNAPNLEQQQLQLTDRLVRLGEAQQRLSEQMERHQRILAEAARLNPAEFEL